MVETHISKTTVRDGFPPGLLESFARLLVESGRLERIVYLAIKNLKQTGYSKGLQHALKQWQFQMVCDELERLFKERYGAEATTDWMQDFVCTIKRYAEFRNELVHSMWTMDNSNNAIAMRIRLDRRTKELVETNVPVHQHEIDQLALSIRRAWIFLNKKRRAWPGTN